MKKIEAIIKPQQLDSVNAALAAAGAHGMTVTEVKGTDVKGTAAEAPRTAPHANDFAARVHIEIVLPDELVVEVIGAIRSAAQTGSTGDGKVFVSNIDEVIRIRTGEHGVDAL
jgi:nitrogen regulatory protein P-II 1